MIHYNTHRLTLVTSFSLGSSRAGLTLKEAKQNIPAVNIGVGEWESLVPNLKLRATCSPLSKELQQQTAQVHNLAQGPVTTQIAPYLDHCSEQEGQIERKVMKHPPSLLPHPKSCPTADIYLTRGGGDVKEYESHHKSLWHHVFVL